MNGGSSALRGALVIVLAGSALGMAYNSVGLRSHPPHGIPWIAVKEELPSLESMAPDDSIAMALQASPQTTAPETAAPPAAGPGHDTAPSTGTHRDHAIAAPGGLATTKPPAGGSAPATGGTSEPAAPSSPMPEPRRPAPPPFVPDGDKPIQVQLAMVSRFYAARAALFIDARDAAEYEAGHIPGAVRLTGPEANSDPDRIKNLPVQGRPIICYCEGGACEASLDLAKVLIDAGFKKVMVYMGGYPEWSQAGQPVEQGAAK